MSSPSQSLELVRHHLKQAFTGEPAPSFTEAESDAVMSAVLELSKTENLSHVTSLGLATLRLLLDHLRSGWQAERATRLALTGPEDGPCH